MPIKDECGDGIEYAHLLGQLEERQRQLAEASETVDLFKNKLDKLRAYNDGVVGENALLQQKLLELEEQLVNTQNELERAFQEQRTSREQWRSQLEAQTDEIRRLHKLITTQEDVDAEKFKMASDLENEYNRKLSAMESKLASNRKKCGELQRELDQEKIRSAMERQDADAALRKAREDIKGEEEIMQRRLAEAETEVKRYAEQVAQIPKLKAQIMDMGAKMKEGSTLVASLKEQHEETVSGLQARIDAQRMEILSKGKEARDALAEKAKADKVNASLTEESARRAREIERLEASAAAMRRGHAEEKKALEKDAERRLAGLQSKLTAQEGCVERLEKELDRKCQECCEHVNRAAEQVREAERKVEDIQGKFDEEMARVTLAHEAEVCELHRRLAGMNTACTEAKQTVGELEAALRSLDDRSHREVAEKEDKAVVMASTLEQMKAQLRTAEDRAAEFEQMARDYNMLQSKHRETLAHLTNTVEKLEERERSIAALKAELKDMNRAHEYEKHKAIEDADQWAQEAQQTRIELLEMSRHSQAVAEELRRTRSYAKKLQTKNKQKIKDAHTKVSSTNDKLKQLVRLQGHIEKRASESNVSYEQRIAELRPLVPVVWIFTLSASNGYNLYPDPTLPDVHFRHTTMRSARHHSSKRDKDSEGHRKPYSAGGAQQEETKENGSDAATKELDVADLERPQLWPADQAT
ncbi:hypothetical protein FOL47_003585 [Perkinsus chesapeaki]|uniref:Uncharacterized protein n=1 Tax=Perkinsus chesapeaki TaxID=330153 RepID=A0A7J6M7A1_PERCH|nr:hypothetical protein FOL47_003585 [Perkinsus chesapeaki]